MKWQTMDDWRAPEGPKNGTAILVLLSDGERTVANFSGMSQRWYRGEGLSSELIPTETPPVAWCGIPAAPTALVERIKFIKTAREQLNKLETSALAAG